MLRPEEKLACMVVNYALLKHVRHVKHKTCVCNLCVCHSVYVRACVHEQTGMHEHVSPSIQLCIHTTRSSAHKNPTRACAVVTHFDVDEALSCAPSGLTAVGGLHVASSAAAMRVSPASVIISIVLLCVCARARARACVCMCVCILLRARSSTHNKRLPRCN